jgi:hypothetical protein
MIRLLRAAGVSRTFSTESTPCRHWQPMPESVSFVKLLLLRTSQTLSHPEGRGEGGEFITFLGGASGINLWGLFVLRRSGDL